MDVRLIAERQFVDMRLEPRGPVGEEAAGLADVIRRIHQPFRDALRRRRRRVTE
jgi:hypothetical protein